MPAILVLACAASCMTIPTISDDKNAETRTHASVNGCDALRSQQSAAMVIIETSSSRRLTCNTGRANERFVPASTFKIPHTLIALQSEAVASIEVRFPWDGQDRGVPSWNRDLSLREAVTASAPWVFQHIAVRIGHDTEAAWIDRLDYGNENVGDSSNLRHFWLSGPTRISANEQVDFLIRLRNRELPASESVVSQTIAALHVAETQEGYIIYGKTGAMLPIDDNGFLRSGSEELLPKAMERTGWFVGWVERPDMAGGPVFFAYNLDLDLPGAMAARTIDTYAVLRINGFPAPE